MSQLPRDTALKEALLNHDPQFWELLKKATLSSFAFEELLFYSNLRKRALSKALLDSENKKFLKVAIIGGYNFFPFVEILEHILYFNDFSIKLFKGEYDNYNAEILDANSELYQFKPDLLLIAPSAKRCIYEGGFFDSQEDQKRAVQKTSTEILNLCNVAHEKSSSEIILFNFLLPANHELGALRSKTLKSDWTYKKSVNLEMGLSAPDYVHICDQEFLSCRLGTKESFSLRYWYENKQFASPELLTLLAKEIGQIFRSLYNPPKKVLVLDLDNTLWGGVIGDDGLAGIELGDTSPRGEAFKYFHKAILLLKQRGVLLAICSKNDYEKAIEPFEKHPEALLKLTDFVSIQANWEPKADNIRKISSELNLGLDSFVFVDDNPAEIEIVNQFAPEVATILLGPDPSEYVAQLENSRFFEPLTITKEDVDKTFQYSQDRKRTELLNSSVDMDAYLASLEMVATFEKFNDINAPRIAQLINKSNQFNLTTKRRTLSEVQELSQREDHVGFTVRLSDRFGDHGLISVVICKVERRNEDSVLLPVLSIDTWLMSCRVLKRQVEEEVLNKVVEVARNHGVSKIEASFIPTTKNQMVKELLPNMGFQLIEKTDGLTLYELTLIKYVPFKTKIKSNSF